MRYYYFAFSQKVSIFVVSKLSYIHWHFGGCFW
nr:MAG TPA: hypothetical protein [Caudoviricetes sp.]